MTGFSPARRPRPPKTTAASRRPGRTAVGPTGGGQPPVDTPDLSEAAQDDSGDDVSPGAEAGSGDAAASRDPTGPQGQRQRRGGASGGKGRSRMTTTRWRGCKKARGEAAENYDRYLRAAGGAGQFSQARRPHAGGVARGKPCATSCSRSLPLMDNMRRALAQDGAEAQSPETGCGADPVPSSRPFCTATGSRRSRRWGIPSIPTSTRRCWRWKAATASPERSSKRWRRGTG